MPQPPETILNRVIYDLVAALIAVLVGLFVAALLWVRRAPSFPKRRNLRQPR